MDNKIRKLMETVHTISDLETAGSAYSSPLPLRTFLYSALGLCTIFYYLQFGAPLVSQYYFNGAIIPNLHVAIISLLIVLTLTAIGCSIHVRVLGGFEKNDVQREIKREIGRLRTIYASVNTKIAETEKLIFDHQSQLSPRGNQAFRTLKKIASALEKRINSASVLAKTEKLPELFRATEILRKKLKTAESATTSLIDVDPIPAIEPRHIETVIKSLYEELEINSRLAA